MNLLHRRTCRSKLWRWIVGRRLPPWALDRLDPGEEDVLGLESGPVLNTDLLSQRTARLTAVERSTPGRRRRYEFCAVASFTMLHHVPSVTLRDRLLAEADAAPGIHLRLTHIACTMVPAALGQKVDSVGLDKVEVKKRFGEFRFRAIRPP